MSILEARHLTTSSELRSKDVKGVSDSQKMCSEAESLYTKHPEGSLFWKPHPRNVKSHVLMGTSRKIIHKYN